MSSSDVIDGRPLVRHTRSVAAAVLEWPTAATGRRRPERPPRRATARAAMQPPMSTSDCRSVRPRLLECANSTTPDPGSRSMLSVKCLLTRCKHDRALRPRLDRPESRRRERADDRVHAEALVPSGVGRLVLTWQRHSETRAAARAEAAVARPGRAGLDVGDSPAHRVCRTADSEQPRSESCVGTECIQGRCDLDHPAVAWSGGAVI